MASIYLMKTIKAIRFTDYRVSRISLPSIQLMEPSLMSDLMISRVGSVRPAVQSRDARHPIPSLAAMLHLFLTRRELLDLTPRQRADIGVSASAALAEATRLPWDARG
jgi:uncharacterized protein YjiS (DUF1127 family)